MKQLPGAIGFRPPERSTAKRRDLIDGLNQGKKRSEAFSWMMCKGRSGHGVRRVSKAPYPLARPEARPEYPFLFMMLPSKTCLERDIQKKGKAIKM